MTDKERIQLLESRLKVAESMAKALEYFLEPEKQKKFLSSGECINLLKKALTAWKKTKDEKDNPSVS